MLNRKTAHSVGLPVGMDILSHSLGQLCPLLIGKVPCEVRILAEPKSVERAVVTRTQLDLVGLIATAIETLGPDRLDRAGNLFHVKPLHRRGWIQNRNDLDLPARCGTMETLA